MSGNLWQEMGFVEQFSGGKANESEAATPAPDESEQEELAPGKAYRSLPRLQDRASTLEFRPKQGEPQAISYSFFRSAVGGHGDRLVLYFVPGDKVTLIGKGLSTVRDLIYSHRMVWIQELSRQEAHELDSAVTGMEIEIKHEEQPALADEEQPRRAARRG